MKRFGMLKELMRAVDLVTLAEREPVMSKMLVILRREALGLDSPIAAADLASLSNAMTELEHEAGRVAPLPSVFNRLVEVAIGALIRTAMHPAFPRPAGTVRMRRNCGAGGAPDDAGAPVARFLGPQSAFHATAASTVRACGGYPA
jgi:hypothetical protein